MQFVINSIVIFFYLLIFIKSDPVPCNHANGNPGFCVKLSKCYPLVNLYRKRHKAYTERLYLKQSACYTNNSRTRMSDYSVHLSDLEEYSSLSLNLPGMKMRIKTKVCCPPIDSWTNFVPIPILPATSNPRTDEDTSPEDYPDLGERPNNRKPKWEPQDKIKNEHRNKDDITICGFDSTITNKIIGGNITSVDQYPWVVLLEYAGGLLSCGGSLITSRFIMTAAHCVQSKHGSPLFARLGEFNTSSYPTDLVRVTGGEYEEVNVTIISIESSFAHPDYDRTTYRHDIGLLKLTRNVNFNDFIKIICIPTTDYVLQFTSNTTFTVAGWGDDRGQISNDVKKAVLVPYIPPDTCKRLNRKLRLDEYKICAGGEEGKDTCNGDSGGALMYESDQLYFAVGIVSIGPIDCGVKGKPAVYTNVYKYISWIRDVLKGSVRRTYRNRKHG